MTTIRPMGANTVPPVSNNSATPAGATGQTPASTPPSTPARPAVCDVFEPEGSQVPFFNSVNAVFQSDPNNPSRGDYSKVIDQFNVSKNPRYISACQTSGSTYCSTFVNDVTKAMGAEIPAGLRANGMVDWLNTEQSGWKKVTATEGKTVEQMAQQFANEGRPTVAGWKNPSGSSGHVGMVRPGEAHAQLGPALAQAGSTNFDNKHVINGFGWNRPVSYWVHNPPTAQPAAAQE